MKLISRILGGLLIVCTGFILYEIAKLAPTGKVIGGLVGALLVLAILTGAIFGITKLIASRERFWKLYRLNMLSFEVLLSIVVLVASVKIHSLVPMILQFKNQVQIATVSDEPAKQELWQTTFTSVGNLAPVEGADISNQVAGNVVSINFRSGERVAKGQLLVQLDDSNERAELQGYLAQAKLAELNASRAHELYAKHLISQSDLDTADSNLQQAQSNVANTQANIAKKAIRAPFSGSAGIRNVNIGQFLPVGTNIVTLQALHHMYVSFTLPEQALPMLATRQKVAVTVDAFPSETFSGEVNAIDSKVDPNTHNVRVQALIANPKRELRAGMFANVTVVAGNAQQVVTIPKAAITYSLYGDSVYIVTHDKDGKDGKDGKDDKGKPALKAKEVFIKLGQDRGSRVAVTEGVNAGDMIVTSGMQKLHSGMQVAINNSVTPDSADGVVDK